MTTILKIKTTWIFLLIFLLLADVNSQSNKKDYKGIGFEALDYEKESGFQVSNAVYLLLDSIVKECKAKIVSKPSYTNEEAIQILENIGTVIRKFKINNDDSQLFLTFSKALENKKLDCKYYSLIYLTVGETLSLPLNSMNAPKHVFIYWKDKKNEIYWETTDYFESSKLFYIHNFEISYESISSSAFLNALDYKSSTSNIYSICGYAKYKLDDLSNAIINYDKAIEINPNDIDVYPEGGPVRPAQSFHGHSPGHHEQERQSL